MTDETQTHPEQRTVCASCPVDVGECPDCGMFWWRSNGKRLGCRPASEEDARRIRELQGRWSQGTTLGGIVHAHELPNRIKGT